MPSPSPSRLTAVLALAALTLGLLATGAFLRPRAEAPPAETAYLRWLEQRSMLSQAREAAT